MLRKLFVIPLLIIALISLLESRPTINEQTQTKPESETQTYPNFYGRLRIPEVNIDVALYYGHQQEITDRQDSANIFSLSAFDGIYISDHKSQEFGKLLNVQVGMKGYLDLASGHTLSIECTDVLDGYHTGWGIADENGNTNLDADYIMYTCLNGIHNIRICLWKHS